MRIRLVREVLDKQLIDVTGQNAGKVDGIVLQIRPGEAPTVRYIEVGPITLARRLNRRLGHWVARLDARLGNGRGVPIRIPIARIVLESPSLRLDIRADLTPIMSFEQWLRRVVVSHIPWS
jgi:hypothetical protein